MNRANQNLLLKALTCAVLAVAFYVAPAEEPHRPIDGIMDNSFLIEEAYNQENGVVQHIFGALYSYNRISRPADRRVDMSFTQEWPAYGQTHQLSYTVPYSFVREAGGWTDGVGDVLLNYRFQAYMNERTLTACAPRFSLILPTGDEEKGFGNGTVGYQWNLPVSTTFGDRWFVHGSAGLTYLPDAGTRPTQDFVNYNLGASAIYCVSDRLNLMLEWVGSWNQGVQENGRVSTEFGSVISPGLRYAFNFRNESQMVVGMATPIGLTQAAQELGFFFYFSFEHRVFGKPLESKSR